MTPRERYLACIEHRRPDRVPVSGSFRSEVWEVLERHFETKDRGAISETLGMDGRGVGMGLAVDFVERSVGTSWGPMIPHSDGTFESEWGVRVTDSENGPYLRYVSVPLADDRDLDTYRFPDLDAPGRFDAAREAAPKLKVNYPVSAGTSTFFRNAWDLRGYEQWLMDLYINPTFVEKLLDRMLEYKLEIFRRFGEMGVDVLSLGGDISMHDRLLMAPEMWRRYFKPRNARLLEEGRKYGVKHFFFHSDGNLMEVMEDLVEIGFDIIDPIQPECMDPMEVKERFGDRMTLHGTISSQHTMPYGTEEDVRCEVRDRIQKLGGNGGLVIGPNNVVQFDVPLENLLALYDEAKTFSAAFYAG